MLIHVDESEIKECAQTFALEARIEGSDEINGFANVLKEGKRWRAMGCTPVYLYDTDDGSFCITADEIFGKYLQ